MFDGLRAGLSADRSQFYEDLSAPFYGANRPGNTVSQGLRDSFWLMSMSGGVKGAYDCIKAFSETDLTEDLKKFDIPTLIAHGDDDQIVPIGASALLSSKIVKGSTLKVYPGAPHGLAQTTAFKDTFNTDLLNFIRPDPEVPGGWCSRPAAGYGAHLPTGERNHHDRCELRQRTRDRRPCSRRLRRRLRLERCHRTIASCQRPGPGRSLNPLRGITADSAYVASIFSQIPGRILAVGHSDGGAIITNAATNAGNVAGLVYVAAFAPDEGETLQDIEAGSTDSVLNAAIRPSNYPVGSGPTAVELSIDPASFHDAFAGDLPAKDAAILCAAQRPVAAAAFGEKNGPCGVEEPSRLGSGCERRQGGRRRCRAFHGPARQSPHCRGRRIARDHDLAAPGGHRHNHESAANRTLIVAGLLQAKAVPEGDFSQAWPTQFSELFPFSAK